MANFLQIKKLHSGFEESYLVLTVFQTKELVLDWMKHQPAHTILVIANETAISKYLSIVLDNKLSFEENAITSARVPAQAIKEFCCH